MVGTNKIYNVLTNKGMTTKELIEHLSALPQDAEVMMEVRGMAAYIAVGKPYIRNLGNHLGFHRDCVCIGSEI